MMISKVCPAVISLAAAAAVSASTLEISGNQTIADADFDSTLDGVTEITFANASSALTFDLADDHEFDGTISGAGSVVKVGNGELSLKASAYNAYKLDSGWTVSSGRLVLPQFETNLKRNCEYGKVTVNDPGVLVIVGNSPTIIRGLYGDGLVTNVGANATLELFGGDFSGKIQGTMTFRNDDGSLYLRGAENHFGTHVSVYGGCLGVVKFGLKTDPMSSIGSSNGDSFFGAVNLCGDAVVEYLGEGNEETDKTIHLLNVPTRAGIDGGVHGGLTFSGTWNIHREAGTKAVQSLLLTGPNAENPCIYSGRFVESTRTELGATYITKRGTGTWRFEDNAGRNNRGTIAVEEGSLQFTSIAETNVVCSLGLATQCATEYSAVEWDESKRVDYAYLLGTSNTVGTMEYVGTSDGKVSTRKIALKGDGRLRNSGTGSLDWTGVKVLGDGTNALFLAGSNGGSVKSIEEGDATLSIVKEDAGTWTAQGVKASGGLAVKGGSFRLPSNQYRYFRWVIKKMSGNDSAIYITEFALYDAAGNRLNLNPTIVQKGTSASALQPNQACFEESRAMDKNGDTTPDGANLKNLFDGGHSYAVMQTAWKVRPTGDEDTWLPIVMRLDDAAAEVASYDIEGGETSLAISRGLSDWMLQGSTDGVDWHVVGEVAGFTPPSASNWQWYSAQNPEKAKFATTESRDESLANDWVLSSLEVAQGLSFAPGDRMTVNGLTINAATGGGTLRNVDFGETGTLRVYNSVSGHENLNQTYENVSGLAENVTGWSVEVNGVAKPNYSVACRNGQLSIVRPGMVILFR